MNPKRSQHGIWFLCILLGCLLVPSRAIHAGGGPENVFLVVNPRDGDSLTIANHYIQLRKIPPGSVFYLPWDGPPFETDLATFRRAILQPILDEIEKRQLTPQIDYVVYSSGYPYAVNFSQPLARNAQFPLASLTAATYLYEYLEDDSLLGLLSHTSNWYAGASLYGTPTRAFRAQYGLDRLGARTKNKKLGRHYLLSMMLGYTTGKKTNTVDEVIRYLRLGAQADGSLPRGTIYFVRNEDIRSKSRHNLFQSAADQLRQLGVAAEVVTGVVPINKPDVQGAMIGKATYDWPGSGSTIQPGAICENFTSFGGVMSGERSQTLLADFLRGGAVASSGTVVEPTAIPHKFPHPFLHVHYARGCSVAEAFYQSVAGPYQLLIVGDPLCQPWAQAPLVQVSGVDTNKPLSGLVSFTATASSPSGTSIKYFRVYLDGQLVTVRLPGQPLEFDSRKLPDGYHELRVVAVDDSPIEVQGRDIVPFISVNQGRGIESEIAPLRLLYPDQPAFMNVSSPDSREIRVYRGREEIGKITGSAGRIPLDVSRLGSGPVTLQAVGIPEDEQLSPVFARPVTTEVASPNGVQ